MRIILIMTIVMLILMTAIYAGDYNSQIIISAKWGEADGEFGLIVAAEGNCPQALAVDGKGNLAILDLVNKRVQRYSARGKWLETFPISCNAFDIQFMNESLLLLAPYDYLIQQYDKQGNLIETIAINRNIEFIDGLRIADNDIFVQTIEQLQYNMNEKSQVKQLESVRPGLSAQLPELRFQTRWLDSHHGQLLIRNSKTHKLQTITITTQHELGSLVFLDTDQYDNIYLRKELFAPDGKSYFEVDKLDRDGNVVATIPIVHENIVAPFKPVTVDREGNIYFLAIESTGFSLIRWQQNK